MNKREKKKMEDTYYDKPYSKVRHSHRVSHELSITLSRRQHQNYWIWWNRGYPNRFRKRKYFDS